MSTAFPNEPNGFAALVDHNFTTVTGGVLLDVYNAGSLVSDGTAPLSPSSCLSQVRVVGQVGGGTQLDYYPPRSYPEVFYGFWWKPSNTFEGNPNNSNKIMFLVNNEANSVLLWYGAPNTPRQLVWNNQNFGVLSNGHIASSFGDDPGGRIFLPNVSSNTVSLGAWHKVEWYWKKSTTNTSRDGIVRWWLDGVLCGNYTNINNGQSNWYYYSLNHTWDSVVPMTANWEHRFDHMYISVPGTVAPPALQSLTPPTSSVVVGNQQQHIVTMTTAVSSATTIALSSSSASVATVPSTVTVASGQSTATFNATAVGAGTTEIAALYNGVTRTSSMAVTVSTGGGGGGSPVTYTYASQFSGVQHQDGWSYRDSNGPMASFNPAGDGGNGLWTGVFPGTIWKTGCHPQSTTIAAVLRWTSPSTGSVSITGNAKCYTGEDGAAFSIVQNSSTVIYPELIIAIADTTDHAYSVTQPVAAGDTIDFVYYARNSNRPNLKLDPVIVLTPASTSPTAPTIAGFTPTHATVGSSVVITGTNFNATPSFNTVLFNGAVATVTAASATALTVTVPTTATTGVITVTTSAGSVVSSTTFTVDSPPTPPPTPPTTNYGGNAFLLLVLP